MVRLEELNKAKEEVAKAAGEQRPVTQRSFRWKRKNERPADRDGQWDAFFSTKFIFSIIIDKSIERVSKTVRDILK